MEKIISKRPKITESQVENLAGFMVSVIAIESKLFTGNTSEIKGIIEDINIATSIIHKLLLDKDIAYLTDEEIVAIYHNIELFIFDVIRDDVDIDNIMWAKSIIDTYITIEDYIRDNDLAMVWRKSDC